VGTAVVQTRGHSRETLPGAAPEETLETSLQRASLKHHFDCVGGRKIEPGEKKSLTNFGKFHDSNG
jgi:hypothetical protein